MPSKNTKIIMADLAKRGTKGLEFAKLTMQNEKIDYPKLQEALNHYLSNWHDFTHTGLYSLACEAVGGDPDASVPIQASIALMAAAFDLHDDIIDRSETKHGQLTVYGNYGQDLTLLLGNAFLMQGFTLLVKSVAEVAPAKLRESIDVLKANLFDVGNAHALELGLKGKLTGEPGEYLDFVKKKAASIEADMCFGAIFGGGTESEIKALSQYGRILGILTTLREEFIDIFEIEELAQKMNIDRLPIPMIFAMQDPKTKKEIEKILLKKRIAKKDLETIIDTVYETESVKKLKKEMEDFAAQAIYVLRILQGKELCKQLELWVSSMLEDL
jgi:geranylgeranyl diphosphate synthase, type I